MTQCSSLFRRLHRLDVLLFFCYFLLSCASRQIRQAKHFYYVSVKEIQKYEQDDKAN